MKALLIGRHEPALGDDSRIKVVEQINVTWPRSSNLTEDKLWGEVFPRAHKLEACVLFQNVPGQLVVALMAVVKPENGGHVAVPLMGIVISVPGERLEEITKEFGLNAADAWDSAVAVEAIKVANPRAKVKVVGATLTVTVTPPMKFEFSHIEWLNE